MDNTKFLTELLRLKDIKIKITWFDFKNQDNELHIGVKPYKTGGCCPTCGRRCRIIRVLESRSWINVTILGSKIVFWYAPREINCPTHGHVQEDITWTAPLCAGDLSS
jgi:transposase